VRPAAKLEGVLVRFERMSGDSIQVEATPAQLVAVARHLEARGRRQLAQRLHAIADDSVSPIVVVGDYDVPMLMAAVAATRKRTLLGQDWVRLRDL
jgi:hypothetical protein